MLKLSKTEYNVYELDRKGNLVRRGDSILPKERILLDAKPSRPAPEEKQAISTEGNPNLGQEYEIPSDRPDDPSPEKDFNFQSYAKEGIPEDYEITPFNEFIWEDFMDMEF